MYPHRLYRLWPAIVQAKTVLWIVIFCWSALFGSQAHARQIEKLYGLLSDGRPVEVAQGEALVRFDASVSTAQRRVVLSAAGARVLSELPSVGWTHVALPGGVSVKSGLETLRGLPGVSAEPNRIYRPLKAPNDPQVSNQYHLSQIDAFGGWEFETGLSTRVTIAVIDAGIEGDHPDLASKLIGTSQDCSGGACVPDEPPTAACNHATRVSGIAAAATDNGTGVAGVSWGARLISLKVFPDSGCTPDCSDDLPGTCETGDVQIINALTYAATTLPASVMAGRIVINMSIGGPGPCPASVQAAVSLATGAAAGNAVVVAAAGNDGSSVNSPGNCQGVIPVGATDSLGNVASFSSRGPELSTGGVVAPGVAIVTTDINGATTGGATGTSFSSPLVAGLSALLLAADPARAPDQIRTLLRSSAESVGQDPTVQGAGRVNAFLAARLSNRGTLSDFAGREKSIAVPNPFRPSQSGSVLLSVPTSLAGSGVRVKIYTMDGRLVRDLGANTSWDGRNDAGNPVATGTYLFFVKTDRGQTTGKVALIR
ncbi:MAG: S8 family serine peptidase [Elusimicrobia bacterium]|nr:S8 family serine peptidase [Elusimicrobiota bacterium]